MHRWSINGGDMSDDDIAEISEDASMAFIATIENAHTTKYWKSTPDAPDHVHDATGLDIALLGLENLLALIQSTYREVLQDSIDCMGEGCPAQQILEARGIYSLLVVEE